ncbi:MAG: WecB/TagA/CpsF family glycosyltransferase [Clostridia bacterium]|nr:WecB/TagA/CpsF family glycosyltransferase [Clostridia bacterium]
MRDTVCVLGVNVDRVNMQSAAERAKEYIKTGGAVFTPNPEIIMKAYKSEEYKNVLNSADMVVPDGIGVVYAAKILKKPVPERVAGYDLTCNMLKYAGENDIPVYIYGGKDGIAKKAAENIEHDFGAKVCGYQHGYHKDTQFIIDEIKEKKPGIVLVCLGAPKQEMWIMENKKKFSPCLMIGAGGSADVLAGEAKRAPDIFIKMHLEWFYRLLKQPSRFFRMMVLPQFMITVLFKGDRKNA